MRPSVVKFKPIYLPGKLVDGLSFSEPSEAEDDKCIGMKAMGWSLGQNKTFSKDTAYGGCWLQGISRYQCLEPQQGTFLPQAHSEVEEGSQLAELQAGSWVSEMKGEPVTSLLKALEIILAVFCGSQSKRNALIWRPVLGFSQWAAEENDHTFDLQIGPHSLTNYLNHNTGVQRAFLAVSKTQPSLQASGKAIQGGTKEAVPSAFDNGGTPGQRPIHHEAAKAVRPLLRPFARSQQCAHFCISVAKCTEVGYLRFSESIAVSDSVCLLLNFSYFMGLQRPKVNWR